MGHLGNAISMLIKLQNRQKLKIKDLARELEVDERTIRRYKDQLMQAGIYIDAEPGIYGGYNLVGDNYLLGLTLSDEEYTTLLMLQKELRDIAHLGSKNFSNVIDKLSFIYKKNKMTEPALGGYLVKSTQSDIDREKERNKLIDIHKAALAKRKVEMAYFSLTSGNTKRIVRPYGVFQYKGDMYFVGYCESRGQVMDFKLCRIQEYAVLDDYFEADKEFDMQQFMKTCLGIYQGEEMSVKVRIEFPMSQIISEKIWVENQRITFNEDKSILFEAKMKGMEEIKSWILGMGSSARVLEPDCLVAEMKEELEKLKNVYGNL